MERITKWSVLRFHCVFFRKYTFFWNLSETLEPRYSLPCLTPEHSIRATQTASCSYGDSAEEEREEATYYDEGAVEQAYRHGSEMERALEGVRGRCRALEGALEGVRGR